MKNRRNLEQFPSDGALALALWIACLAILVFTGAGEVLIGRIADYVASWSYR